MTERAPRSVRTADVMFAAGLVAVGVFVVSAGIYAGGDGRVRGVALVVGMVAVALAVGLLTGYGWVTGGRRRT